MMRRPDFVLGEFQCESPDS